MKSKFSIGIIVAAIFAVVLSAFTLNAAESKYSSTSAGATIAVTFGSDPGAQQEVTAILAKSDKPTAAVKLYARGGGGKQAINVASTSGAQVVYFANASLAVNTNDTVVYQHSDGTLLATTVASGVTTGGVTLTTGLTKAGTTEDTICEVTQAGEISVGTTALNAAGQVLFVAPANSPLYVTLDSGTNAALTVTKRP
jgi:hypothetical protein